MSAETITDARARELARVWAERTLPCVHELRALLGWASRRMVREVSEVRAERERLGCDEIDMPVDDNDREALAHVVAQDLGEPFTSDPSGEHGLAWDLCELAGWPSITDERARALAQRFAFHRQEQPPRGTRPLTGDERAELLAWVREKMAEAHAAARDNPSDPAIGLTREDIAWLIASSLGGEYLADGEDVGLALTLLAESGPS